MQSRGIPGESRKKQWVIVDAALSLHFRSRIVQDFLDETAAKLFRYGAESDAPAITKKSQFLLSV